MNDVRLRDRIKKYKALSKESHESYKKFNGLRHRLFDLADILFVERLQPTKGFLKPKVMDYVVPNDWGKKDPCSVTIFRNGMEDLLDGYMCNFGTDEDVKTFYCPNFKEDAKCTCECPYRLQNNEYFDLDNNLIPEAEIQYEELLAKRHIAWNQIFHKTK